jgi:hypothetical protein
MPAAAVDRLRVYPQITRDRGVLRVAGWLTAAAAAVLLVALLNKPPDRTELAAGPEIWETFPTMSPTELRDAAGSDTVLIMTQYMADDLSAANSGGF